MLLEGKNSILNTSQKPRCLLESGTYLVVSAELVDKLLAPVNHASGVGSGKSKACTNFFNSPDFIVQIL